jgi:hypothetical protein
MEVLMAWNKLSLYRTVIFERDGWQCVQYAKTIIVKWNASEIILDTGGWKSVTTKRKMNQTANQFNLGFSIFQRKGTWYVQKDEWPQPLEYVGDMFGMYRG